MFLKDKLSHLQYHSASCRDLQCELLVGTEFLAPLLVAQQVLAGVFFPLQVQVFHGVRRYVYGGVGILVAEVHSHEQRFLAVLRLAEV